MNEKELNALAIKLHQRPSTTITTVISREISRNQADLPIDEEHPATRSSADSIAADIAGAE